MKFQLLFLMLFDLLQRRKLTAGFFADKYQLSTRTVYRYLDVLSSCLPLQITRGRNGGVCLPDQYKLPLDFLSEGEYEATMYALERAYAHDPSPYYLAAQRKIAACKVENIDFLN